LSQQRDEVNARPTGGGGYPPVPAATVPGRAQVLRAVDEVEAAFPFPGYISRGLREALATVIPIVASHLSGPGRRLLDLGAGPMDKTAVWSRLGFDCHASDDLSDPWHDRDGARARIIEFAGRMGIRFHLDDCDAPLPFPRESFDVVTVCDVIEHLHASPRGILNAAGEHLVSGGLLVVTMPNSVNLRKRIDVLRGRSNYPPVDQFFLSTPAWRGHVREYTLRETEYICRAAGFEVVHASTFEAIAFDQLSGPSLRVFLALARLVPTLRSGLLVVARKPAGWKPLAEDPAAFRQAQARSVPGAVA
jgi:SAM-dependent methyltransferase